MPKGIVTWTCLSSGCLAAFVLAAAACSDDEPAAAAPVVVPDTGVPDTGTVEDAGSGWDGALAPKPGVLHLLLELAPQPLGDAPQFNVAANIADYPGAAQLGYWGIKPPKKAIAGAIPALGCQVSVFNASNPPPSAPDQGDLTVSGYTGGAFINMEDGGLTPYTAPGTCKRTQGANQVFDYQCSFAGAPSTNFFDKTDRLKVAGAGGADLDKFSVDVPSPLHSALNVSTNLMALTAQDLDGSKDLTVNFDCDGQGCDQAGFIGVFIQTSDNPNQANPFDFPAPTAEAGLATCLGLAITSTNSYTVPASMLAELPKDIKAARVIVAALNVTEGGTESGKYTVIAAGGIARYGVTNFAAK